MESHQLETSWDLRLFALRRTLGLKTCVASEEFGATSLGREERSTIKPCTASNAHASARKRRARHASMECDRPSPTNTQRTTSVFGVLASNFNTSQGSHGLDLTGFSATPPLSLKELRTPQALAISIAGHTVRKIYEQCTRSTPASSSRSFRRTMPRELVWTDTSDNPCQYRNKLHEEIGKCCEQAVGALR